MPPASLSAERFFALLLRTLPASHRRRFERDLLEMFRDGLRDEAGGRRLPQVGYLLRASFDLLSSAVILRSQQLARLFKFRWHAFLPSSPPIPEGSRSPMQNLLSDLRYGARGLLRTSAFTTVAVATLALGIGANTAIFSVLNTILLKPLPFEQPGQLVHVWEHNALKGWTRASAAPANLLDWQKRSTTLADLAAYSQGTTTWTGQGEPRQITAATATGNLFSVLGVPPLVGRLFEPGETWQGGPPVVIAGHGFWRTHLGANPDVVGQTLTLDGTAAEIIGVLPSEARLAEFVCCDSNASTSLEPDVWRPTHWDPAVFGVAVWTRRAHWLNVIGRLEPTATIDQARAELASIAAQLEKEYPETNEQMGVGLTPLRESMVAQLRQPLALLMGAVTLVLLIACVNVANLLVARGIARTREVSIRNALGAGRRRIIGQLLAESLLLASLGGLVGVGLAVAGTRLLSRAAPADLPRLAELSLDSGILLFALGLSIATVVLFGLAPAWMTSRTDVVAGLQQGGRQGSGGGRQRFRQGLVVVEVALSLVLVAGSGLLLRSLMELRSVDPGYNPTSVLSARISLPGDKYNQPGPVFGFFLELLEKSAALPSVESAALASALPIGGAVTWSGDATIEGQDRYVPEFRHKTISTEYFDTMGTRLIEGRVFAETDRPGAEPVALVNQTFARFYEQGSIVGKRIKTARPDQDATWLTVAGVVADEKYRELAEPSPPQVYQPFLQAPRTTMTLVVRSAGDPEALVPALRRELAALEPRIALAEVATLETHISGVLTEERFVTQLISALALLAIVLAAVGIYGVMAYSVSQRRQEFGIRAALGARIGDLIGLVLRQGIWTAATGIVLGVVGVLATGRLISGLLFQVSPYDPLTLVAGCGLMLAVALVASYWPARRAAAADPQSTLRAE